MHVELAALRCLNVFFLFMGVLVLTGCGGVAGTTTPPAPSAYDGPVAVSPANVDFGNVRMGNDRTLNVTLSNPGKASVSLSQEVVTGRGFTATGVGSNLTLDPGQSVALTVDFRPAAKGSATGSVTVSTTLSTKPITILLDGTGVPASGHYVSLRWNPSTSSVIGYHIYRRGSGQKYKKVNNGLNRTTSYTDTTVTAGQKYFYAVKAVGNRQTESAFSNEVSVTVPSP